MATSSLVIVESPAKAKTIGKYLGPGYQVKACMGHLRDLPKSTLGVDIENDFQPNYRPIKGKEDIISDLKKAAKSSDVVYLATDPDREGEAISWHLKELLNLDDSKALRVTFNEITKRVVSESIAAPRDIDQSLVDAQQARASPPGGSSPWPPGWSVSGSMRSPPSSPRSTGPWTHGCPRTARRKTPFSPTTTAKTAKKRT